MLTRRFFNEITLRLTGKNAYAIVEKLAHKGVLAGVPYSRLAPKTGHDDLLIVASTEVNTDGDRAALWCRG